MICRACNKEAYQIHSYYDGVEMQDICNLCGDLRSSDAAITDSFLHRIGQTFANLTDKMGRPIEIQSKRHKKQVMDQLGVSEAGDTVNGKAYGSQSWIEGSRAYRSKQFAKDRPMIQRTLRDWKEKQRASH